MYKCRNKKTEEFFNEEDLSKFRAVFPRAERLPVFGDNSWICTCSARNSNGDVYCKACGASASRLKACLLNRETLNREYTKMTAPVQDPVSASPRRKKRLVPFLIVIPLAVILFLLAARTIKNPGTAPTEALPESLPHPEAVPETAVSETPAMTSVQAAEVSDAPSEVSAGTDTVPESTGSPAAELPHTHIFASEVTLAPGCESNGVRTYICRDCGHTRTETISPAGHIYLREETVVPPSCTSEGTVRFYCDCGKFTERAISAAGHDFAAATCTLPETCTRCGLSRGTPLGHDEVSGICSRCRAVLIKPEPQFFDGYLQNGNTDTYSVALPEGTYNLTATMVVDTPDASYDFLYEWLITAGSANIRGSDNASVTRQITVTESPLTLKIRVCGSYSIVIAPQL